MAMTRTIIKTEKIHNILSRLRKGVGWISGPQRGVGGYRGSTILFNSLQVQHCVPRVTRVLKLNCFNEIICEKILLTTGIERGFLGLQFFLLVHCSLYSHLSNTSRDWHNSMSVPDQLKITVYSFSKYLFACMCLSVHNVILFEAKVGAIKKGES